MCRSRARLRGLGSLAASAASLVLPCTGEVLLVRKLGDQPATVFECEAIAANWNQGLEDSGTEPFAGRVSFDEANPHGCDTFAPASGTLALVDSARLCGHYTDVVGRAAAAGARGVIFMFYEEDTVGGIALGDHQVPNIRAVMIERRYGEALRTMLAEGLPLAGELHQGLLISEDAYQEQFIFRADEITATRPVNFMWHTYPSMLPTSGLPPLSLRAFQSGLKIPDSWFSQAPSFVPLFNPSLVEAEDGTSLLATLRISNGPGCPSVRRSGESSMDTRVFLNKLILVQLDLRSLEVIHHVPVEMMEFECHFGDDTEVSGRRFLELVRGPMDARITKGAAEDELWVSFYAEQNVAGSNDVARGIYAARLRTEWSPCMDAGQAWELLHKDAALAGPSCVWLGSSAGGSSEACHRACDGQAPCNAVSIRDGHCELHHCPEKASTMDLPGWSTWRRILATPPSSSKSCNSDGRCTGGARRSCLSRAWVNPSEVLSFPAPGTVEKNWNFIRIEESRLFIEYHIEPHIVLEAHIERISEPPSMRLVSLAHHSASRWPYEVIHGISNVRGGYCCLALPLRSWRGKLHEGGGAEAEAALPDGPLLLGVGHLQRIRTPYDDAPGDLARFRRQAKSRTYMQFFYALRREEPFDVVAVSHEWCITVSGHFSEPWRAKLIEGEEMCEAIQFASGLALNGQGDLVVGYGINDCEADLLLLPLDRALGMLRPVQSTKIAVEDLEVI